MPSWIASALSTLSAQERAVYLASIAAVALGWVTARQKGEHRTVAVLLSIGLASDVVRRAIHFAVLAPAYLRFGRAPLEGWALVVGQMGQALFLAWPAALVASARVSFDVSGASTRRSFLLISVVWAAASATLALTYPITRGPVLARCYLAVQIVALLVIAVAIARLNAVADKVGASGGVGALRAALARGLEMAEQGLAEEGEPVESKGGEPETTKDMTGRVIPLRLPRKPPGDEGGGE